MSKLVQTLRAFLDAFPNDHPAWPARGRVKILRSAAGMYVTAL